MNTKKREQLQKILAYDEAIGKLAEAGIADEFLKAVDKNPELLKAIQKIAPDFGPGPRADWSCCITVSSPLKKPGAEVINPATERVIR
jgi:malate synthase